MTGVKIKA